MKPLATSAPILLGMTVAGLLATTAQVSAQCGLLRQSPTIDNSLPRSSLGRAVRTGDLDGDSQDEIVLGVWQRLAGMSNFAVMDSDLDGTFSLRKTVAVPGGLSPIRIECDDFNDDGFDDVVMIARDSSFSGAVLIYLSDGTGDLILTDSHIVGSPFGVATGHVDRDGNVDVVTFNIGTDTVSVFLGDGAGGLTLSDTLTLTSSPPASRPTPLHGRISDTNGDGRSDLLFVCEGDPFSGDLLGVSLGDGSGSFGPVAKTRIGHAIWSGFLPTGIASGDFNKDGVTDLAVPRDSRIALLLSDGSGDFDTLTFSYPGNARLVEAAHINQDGHLDLWISGRQDSLYHALGDGTGTFTRRGHVTLGAFTASGMVSADFDADGATDLLVAAEAMELRSWLGTCIPYQGDTDEVSIESLVNEGGIASDPLKPLRAGQTLEMSVVANEPTRLGSLYALVAQTVSAAPASLGNRIHIDLGAPFFTPLMGQLSTPAASVSWRMPPGMAGQTVMAQAFVLNPVPGVGLETTHAHALTLKR